MKKTLTLFSSFLFFSLLSQLCFAQNLVLNPSFENYDTCVTSTNQVYYSTGWSSFGKTPDYYNACNSSFMSVPVNFVGHQQAATGIAYCGMGCFDINDSTTREYIGTSLSSPLLIGQKYFVSAKFCLAGGSSYSIAIRKLSIRFSMSSYSQNSPPSLNNFAHIISDSLITDTTNWYLMKGSFIADSTYQYVIVGNFFENHLCDTFKLGNNAYASYYLADDICVSSDSLTCYFEKGEGMEELTENLFSLNVENNQVIIKNHSGKIFDADIRITDMLGKNTFEEKIKFSSSIRIGIENLKPAIYLLSMKINNKFQTIKFLKP